jgi:hypothetical protein
MWHGIWHVAAACGSTTGFTVSRPLILNPLSRSIVCSQKPQQENSCRQRGWGTIQPLQIAGAGLID